ncbi:MAG: GNAT family N-acetyltransferase [Blastocatellia bacterium]|nr:GNAT family N-acetyltransferase [Blastocatellia bacterium]
MNSEYRIRRATIDDATIIAHHRAAMFRDMGDLRGDDVARIEDAAFVYMRQMMAERRYLGWLVERESEAVAGAAHGEVVAGAGIIISQLLPRPGAIEGGAQALIANVYCEPEHRRRGLARALITAMLDWCKRARMAKVVLHASPDGRPLYESLGFVQTNEMRWQGPKES